MPLQIRYISFCFIVTAVASFCNLSIAQDLHLDEGPMLPGQPTITEIRTIPQCMAVARQVYSARGISESRISNIEYIYRTNYERLTSAYSDSVEFPDWNAAYQAGLDKIKGYTYSEIDNSELAKVCSNNLNKMRVFINSIID